MALLCPKCKIKALTRTGGERRPLKPDHYRCLVCGLDWSPLLVHPHDMMRVEAKLRSYKAEAIDAFSP